MITIGWIRHGLTDWNAAGKIQGHTDIPLNESGLRQAKAIAKRLASEQWDAIICSDLQRAVQTAQAIAEGTRAPVLRVDPRLRERAYGNFEGLTVAERMKRWGENWWKYADEQGAEPSQSLVHRGMEVVRQVESEFAHKRVLLVTHGGLLRQMFRTLIPDHYREGMIHNASLTVTEKHQDDLWRCRIFNSIEHLTNLIT